MTKRLYLMRHGETLFNTQKRVQGWSDSPLTQTGIQQGKEARDWFKANGVSRQAIYSSTQERATDTARLVAEHDNIKQLKGLKEMNFGIFEAQPENLLPKFRPGSRSFEDLLVPYGGEDIIQVGKRVHQAIVTIAEEDSAQEFIMVSHGAALWGLIQYLDIAFPEGLSFGNCNICLYDYENGSLMLRKVIDPLNKKEVVL
ncbi:histidine phosphatase family protein [Streptococcus sobrinus]|uniref:histidine phosphatase family protein n=1 Tax=Streptococcus sobrinus TaxID=1310 RepID=UPI0018A92455|nr:histidine phosphatase family protein [Streptococcus sobrinus]